MMVQALSKALKSVVDRIVHFVVIPLNVSSHHRISGVSLDVIVLGVRLVVNLGVVHIRVLDILSVVIGHGTASSHF